MAQENKYDGESTDEIETEDYFSINFFKRLEQLQAQSKKLENLQFQLLTIKDANYVTTLDTICGVSIVQPQSKSQSKSKRKKRNKSNYKVVFTLFTESETERAFEAARMNDFKSESHSFWKDTFEAQNASMCSLIQLVETSYTLFRKTLNNKDFIFLMVGNHINDSIEEYRLVDILQSMIVDLCQSLQIKCVKTKYKSNNDEKSEQIKERKMSLTAMVEILEEVFGGSSDDTYPLNKTEFVTCMTVRLGMKSVWKDDTKERLEYLFESIIEGTDDEDIDVIQSNHGKYKCLRFDNFISYFSPNNISNFSNSNENDSEYNNRFKDWKDIKHAVHKSPLSKRNKQLRHKANVSASKYREKLNNIEKLINLLEESVIFNESGNGNDIKMVKNEQLFWRKQIFKHREFVRFYQDVILKETIEENQKMKLKIDKLIKLNKFSKKVQFEENEWFKKNKHLIQIESQYYQILQKQKNQTIQMKQCEKEIKDKDDQIIELKSKLQQLIDLKNQNIAKKNGHKNGNKNVLNAKILKLKKQIAQKKFEIKNELDVISANIKNDKNKQKQDMV